MSKKFKVLYRPYRGGLEESMRELKQFSSVEDFFTWLCAEYFDFYGQTKFSINDINISYYSFDDRIDWHSYIVSVNKWGNFDYLKEYSHPLPLGFLTFKYDF